MPATGVGCRPVGAYRLVGGEQMGEERPPRMSEPDGALVEWRPGSKAANRRLFREMVKGEIEDRPLSWSRRRSLIRFARRLEIDPFEARLLIRAVEYECGHVAPAAMDEVRTSTNPGYLLPPGTGEASVRLVAGMLIGILVALVVLALR